MKRKSGSKDREEVGKNAKEIPKMRGLVSAEDGWRRQYL
jgi:hypothetical protein